MRIIAIWLEPYRRSVLDNYTRRDPVYAGGRKPVAFVLWCGCVVASLLYRGPDLGLVTRESEPGQSGGFRHREL